MPLQPGMRLGHYEVLSSLGAGGMGEVYRARDGRLGREVAIKVLPDDLARDGERLARFEREARALAALNHPNVATLHGFEREGESPFLVMELVEGEDLAARIARGPIPVDEAIRLFLQIAEGLEAAHEKGILHRDLKPANVKVGPDGRVKILDFGLAKAMVDEQRAGSGAGGAGSLDDLTHSPTLTAQATRAGTLLGTAAYMSPEQARGIPADARAEVWAFGRCFYETLTGKRLFAGEDAPQTLASVLKDAPDWSALPADLPHHVAVLLRRCLEKNRRARWQSTGDLRIELQESLTPPAELASTADAPRGAPRVEPHPWPRRLAWLFAAAAAFFAIVAGYTLLDARAGQPEPRVIHIPLALPDEGGVHYYFPAPPLAISSDGTRIAYAGSDEQGPTIWLQDLNQASAAQPVRGSRGAFGPFFSPDGESLGYLRDTLHVVSLSGSEPRKLDVDMTIVNSSATWDGDGSIYYVDTSRGIGKVAAAGGSPPEPVTRPAAPDVHNNPQPLPGGDHVLHASWPRGETVPSVVATATASQTRTVLFPGGFAPRYVPTGHLLVAQADLLLAMTFDPGTLAVGRAVPVLRGLLTDMGEGIAAYAVSDSGSLVYMTGALEQDGWLVRLTPEREPERLNRRPTDFDYLGLKVSPDGTRVALSRNDGDLWIFDLEARDLTVRITTDPALDWDPVWHPTVERLAFASQQGGGWSAFARRADGLGAAEPLIEEDGAQKWPASWSPAGDVLLYTRDDPATQGDIWHVPDGKPEAAEVFLATEFNDEAPAFSPDGRWVAYASDETGRYEVWITSYPDRDVKQKISRDGGHLPRWSADGTLFFASGLSASGRRVLVVEGLGSGGLAAEPRPFVEGVDTGGSWDVTPDGRSVIALERRAPPQLHLVQNWFEELKRLVPVDG